MCSALPTIARSARDQLGMNRYMVGGHVALHWGALAQSHEDMGMKPMDEVRRLVDCWPASGCTRPEPRQAVWYLKATGGRGDDVDSCHQCKVEFLSRMRGRGAYLHHPDDPRSWGLTGEWRTVAPLVWEFPRSLDFRDPRTDRWLFTLGNWTLFVGEAGDVGTWPDLFRASAKDVLEWMRSVGVRVLVSSFPDDTEWLLAVA